MKRLLGAMTAAVLMVALVSSAAIAGGGNSANAKLCQKGGYLLFIGAVGPFATEGACVSFAAKGGSLYAPIGIVLPSYWTQDQAPFQDALKAAGYGAQLQFSVDSATEQAAVERLISRGIKVLIITPQDGASAAAAADEARAAGVKVIANDRLILNTTSVDYYLTFDGRAVGAAQAQYLIDKAGTTKDNDLYLYAGAPWDNNSFLFLEGAWETLWPRMADGTFFIRNSDVATGLQGNDKLSRDQESQVIAQITTNWDFDTAKNLAEANLLAAAPANNKAFILAPNDETARAITDAFAAYPVTTFFVTGQDANIPWVQYLIDGTQGMTVLKDPRERTHDAVAAAVTFVEGLTPVATTTFNNGAFDVPTGTIEFVPVTIDNIQAALIDSGYYRAGDFTGSWPGKAP